MHSEEIKEIIKILTDVRISLAEMKTIQAERSKETETIKEDVKTLNQKLNWASGVMAAATLIVSFLSPFLAKKMGLS